MEFQLLLRFHFFFPVVFLCSCISVLLAIVFFRDEVLGTTTLEGPLVAIQKKEKLLFRFSQAIHIQILLLSDKIINFVIVM